jgi:hypothetical protein
MGAITDTGETCHPCPLAALANGAGKRVMVVIALDPDRGDDTLTLNDKHGTGERQATRRQGRQAAVPELLQGTDHERRNEEPAAASAPGKIASCHG